MQEPLVTALITNTMVLGFVISVFGGVVAASHAYSKERKKIPPSFDWVDFLLLSITGTFSGFIGFLLASWKIEELVAILAIAGLSAIGGYGMLVIIKDLFLEVLKAKVSVDSQAAEPNENNSEIYQQDAQERYQERHNESSS